MRDTYDTESSIARRFEERKNPAGAAVHWIAAAHRTTHLLTRIEALTEARRCVEDAFVSAVIEANEAGYPWREIAPHTDMAWQSLHRRYGNLVGPKRIERRRGQ